MAFIFLFLLKGFNADSQISSATFGMMEARWLGPGTMGGRISVIEGVNEDGKTIYIGTAVAVSGRPQMPGPLSNPSLISTVNPSERLLSIRKIRKQFMRVPVKVICVIQFLSAMDFINQLMPEKTGLRSGLTVQSIFQRS
jgi:hypothetical protein